MHVAVAIFLQLQFYTGEGAQSPPHTLPQYFG